MLVLNVRCNKIKCAEVCVAVTNPKYRLGTTEKSQLAATENKAYSCVVGKADDTLTAYINKNSFGEGWSRSIDVDESSKIALLTACIFLIFRCCEL